MAAVITHTSSSFFEDGEIFTNTRKTKMSHAILTAFSIVFSDVNLQSEFSSETLKEKIFEASKRINKNNTLDEVLGQYFDEDDYLGILACTLIHFYNSANEKRRYGEAVLKEVLSSVRSSTIPHEPGCHYRGFTDQADECSDCDCYAKFVARQTIEVIKNNAG